MKRLSQATADELVAAAWPLDGPYSPERTIEAARAIAELVRYLIYATRSMCVALPYPSDVYGLLGNLSSAQHGLAQTCEQIAAGIEVQAVSLTLSVDELGSPEGAGSARGAVRSAIESAWKAAAGCRESAAHLSLAHSHVGRLRVDALEDAP